MELNANRQAAYSRLFSASVFREMAARGKSALFARLINQSLVPDGVSFGLKVGEAFDAAFEVLRSVKCRDEYIYKAALTHKVLLGKHSLRTASMLTEFRVGDCKADLVIFNGTATVYEIKSERDSLARLEKQLDAYRKVFARVYVISGENHVASVLAMAPDDVGVLKLSDRHQISTVRPALDTPQRLCPLTMLDSLRIDEALAILSILGVKHPKVSNTLLRSELRKIYAEMAPEMLHPAFVTVVKKNRNLSDLGDLVDSLPRSLQTAALSITLRKTEHKNLISAINTQLCDAIHWT